MTLSRKDDEYDFGRCERFRLGLYGGRVSDGDGGVIVLSFVVLSLASGEGQTMDDDTNTHQSERKPGFFSEGGYMPSRFAIAQKARQ